MRNEDTFYLKCMINDMLAHLDAFAEETKNKEFVFSSSHRASFRRLRLELCKNLLAIEEIMYGKN